MTDAVAAPLNFKIHRLVGDELAGSLDALADILIDSVEGGASVSFLWPLTRADALNFWRGVAESVDRNERILLIAEDEQGAVVGTAQLITDMPENQPHRAEVAKMLVHRKARRQGVAQRLMAAIDTVAQAEGRTVLVLDTATGGDAERLYQRAGWKQVGVIPNYALMPDGKLASTTFFFKQF